MAPVPTLIHHCHRNIMTALRSIHRRGRIESIVIAALLTATKLTPYEPPET